MRDNQFLFLIGEKAKVQMVNLDHVVRVEADNGVVLHLSDGHSVVVQGEGSALVFELLAKHSILPDGSQIADFKFTEYMEKARKPERPKLK